MGPNNEPANPGVMSFTRTVPALVPSVRHSSLPASDVLALKKTMLPSATNLLGAELPKPGQMSLTSDVPAAVPLAFQSSRPMLVLLCLLVCGAAALKENCAADSSKLERFGARAAAEQIDDQRRIRRSAIASP
jgi:hypothetical protein